MDHFDPTADSPSDKAVPTPQVTLALMISAVAGTLYYWSYPDRCEVFLALEVKVWEHQLWRLLTSVFLHGDIIHLAFNLYWLWRFGGAVEPWFGMWRYLGFIFVVAVGSSAAQFLTGNGGIGLSGVGYALFGLLFSLRRDEKFAARLMDIQVIYLFVFWFFLCIVLTRADVWHVGNAAHGAGAAFGWLFGQAIRTRRKVAAAGVCVISAVLVLATQYMPWDGRYAWHVAGIYADQKDYHRALKWYRRAAELLPKEDGLRKNVEWAETMIEIEEQQQ